jgi:tRNA1Val (adenine37-N6)-methyltransferase
MFRFKQFTVDQTGCAMKINTDGVLLGAIAKAEEPKTILDIGTGTGVIALMLAQKYPDAKIDAVEIDVSAAKTAAENFRNSPFHSRMRIFPVSIETFFDENPADIYDLIISNPPFYLNLLESPSEKKSLAKHTEATFFEGLIKDISLHLSPNGKCWLVSPLSTASLATEFGKQNRLFLQKEITVRSFKYSEPHRQILCLGLDELSIETLNLTIYKEAGIYSEDYKKLLQPYFLAF